MEAKWEGQTLKNEPCTPDNALTDLERRLAALHALGPMEFEPGEREKNEPAIAAMNELSRGQMQHMADRLRDTLFVRQLFPAPPYDGKEAKRIGAD